MIQFQNVPEEGVKESTPAGHYIDMRGNTAQIITVGGHPGKSAYEAALPGYKVVAVSSMPREDGSVSDVFDTRLNAR